ncbi:MAG: glycosyltransferase family 2 protein [Actinobacteria bacterium]|nr:glycosyltransferase family 2 protein [Actinomycetota bacterium]
MYSLVIPVYKNEESLPAVVERLEHMNRQLNGRLEAVFVIDGSPDLSYLVLKDLLPSAGFASQLITLSRNFGSMAAIRQGIAAASGPYFAGMAADLQEPEELVLEMLQTLSTEEVDITIGVREDRADPFFSRLFSGVFWWMYRKTIQHDIPAGGVDVIGFNLRVRDALMSMREANSSLVGLVFWLGFRRKLIPYKRLPRAHGSSGWTFRRKVRYMFDSSFAFTELPITALFVTSIIGFTVALLAGLSVLIAWLVGNISVPGYTPIILMLVFSLSVTLFALGIIGSYIWRTFDNSKGRPLYVPMSKERFSSISPAIPAAAHDHSSVNPTDSFPINSDSATRKDGDNASRQRTRARE